MQELANYGEFEKDNETKLSHAAYTHLNGCSLGACMCVHQHDPTASLPRYIDPWSLGPNDVPALHCGRGQSPTT